MMCRCVSLSVAFLSLAIVPASAQTASSTPKQFHGVWGRDLEQCGNTGEDQPLAIGPRFIARYEQGWTIRRWTVGKGVWVGRGTSDDDQGSSPASVQLQLLPDGKLSFNKEVYVRCPS